MSGDNCYFFSTSIEIASEQKPQKAISAFTACETSHGQRSCCQAAGTSVQLLVAWLAGNVKAKKMTRFATRQPRQIATKTKARRPRIAQANARLANNAPNSTMPNSAQPR